MRYIAAEDIARAKEMDLLTYLRILTAQKIFDALNRTSYLPTEKDIDDAIDFLQSGKLGILKNTDICVKRFIDFFAGE